MAKIEGKLQGTSQSGKAHRINGKWVAISQMTDIKIDGDNISAEIPEWLHQTLTGEKPKNENPKGDKTTSNYKPNKYVKREKTYTEEPKDYIPVQIYTNCTRCNKVGFVSAKSKLCICCVIDLANRNTASDRIKANKITIDKLYKESEADKAKWRQHYAEKEQEELEDIV
jgi:hypothetical protein